MKGIKVLLLLLAATAAPAGVGARGVASVVDSLSRVTDVTVPVRFTVSMPQLTEDVVYNIGVTWSIMPASFMDYLSFTVDGYFNNVTDKIVAFPTTYAWTMANYGKVHVTGVDITLASSFSLSRKVQLTLSGAYTFQKAVDLTDPDSKSYKHQLPYTPRHSGNVSAVIDMPWVDVGYSIVGVGKRYCLSQNIPVNKIDGYAEHTLTVSHEFLFRGYILDLQGEIINLTDKQYDVIKYYPMPGRSWRVTGTFKF